jgi:hypothetical protein
MLDGLDAKRTQEFYLYFIAYLRTYWFTAISDRSPIIRELFITVIKAVHALQIKMDGHMLSVQI